MKKLFFILKTVKKTNISYLFFVFFLNFVNVFAEVFGIASLFPFLNLLFNKEFDLWGYSDELFYLSSKFNLDVFSFLVIFAIIILIIKNIYTIFYINISTNFANQVGRDTSNKLLSLKLSLPYLSFIKMGSDIFLRNQKEVTQNFRTYVQSVITLASELCFLLVVFFIFLYLNFLVTIIVFTIIVIIYLAYLLTFKNNFQYWGEQRNHYSGEINRILIGIYSSIREIKIFSKKNIFMNSYENINLNLFSYISKYDISILIIKNLFEIVILFIFFFIFIFFYKENNLVEQMPVIAIFVVMFFRIYPSVNRCTSAYMALKNSRYSKKIIFFEMNKNQAFYELDEKTTPSLFSNFNFDINIHSVSHSFDLGKNHVLKNLNLKILKNEFYGISGANGSGKSTLLNILLGLIKPLEGSVTMDSKYDIFKYYKDYKKLIGLVPQKPFLLSDTIRSNILLENKSLRNNDEKLISLLSSSPIYSFILNSEKKLDEIIFDNGANFSGGQCQAISIARAMYNDPKILILDEPTTALDEKNKDYFLNYLLNLSKSITLIMVSHDKSALKYCTKTVTLKNGQVV